MRWMAFGSLVDEYLGEFPNRLCRSPLLMTCSKLIYLGNHAVFLQTIVGRKACHVGLQPLICLASLVTSGVCEDETLRLSSQEAQLVFYYTKGEHVTQGTHPAG